METQYITKARGKKISVILPIKNYEKMLEMLEELEDIKAYDEAVSSNEEAIPAIEAFREIEIINRDLRD